MRAELAGTNGELRVATIGRYLLREELKAYWRRLFALERKCAVLNNATASRTKQKRLQREASRYTKQKRNRNRASRSARMNARSAGANRPMLHR